MLLMFMLVQQETNGMVANFSQECFGREWLLINLSFSQNYEKSHHINMLSFLFFFYYAHILMKLFSQNIERKERGPYLQGGISRNQVCQDFDRSYWSNLLLHNMLTLTAPHWSQEICQSEGKMCCSHPRKQKIHSAKALYLRKPKSHSKRKL